MIDLLRSRVVLEAEILILKQQINVLRRTRVPIVNLIELVVDRESDDAGVG